MTTTSAPPASTILTPADPGWDRARQAWNLAVDQRPGGPDPFQPAHPARGRALTRATRRKETSMSAHTTTVAGYLLRRLADAGVRSVFGARGDGDAALFHAIAGHPEVTWIETPTAQAADYAADGYARLRGLGAVAGPATPVPGTAGTAPVAHIVATPPIAPRGAGRPPRPPQSAGATHADLRPGTATAEIDRVLNAAVRASRPVRLSLPADVAIAPVPAPAIPLRAIRADGGTLSRASLHTAVQEFLVPGDVLVTDQAALDGTATLALPDGALLVAAPRSAPAGWAGPAALGASLATPDRRVVVLAGDSGPDFAAGLRALLAQGLAPVIILARTGGTSAPAPAAPGSVTTRVTSGTGLAAALREASRQDSRLTLIEAVLGHPGSRRSFRAAA